MQLIDEKPRPVFLTGHSLDSPVSNWVRELDVWAVSSTKVVYQGNKDARRNAQYRMHQGDFNVLITTYEAIVRDQNVLSAVG